MRKNKQFERVLKWFETHNDLTRYDALNHLGIANLTATISRMRDSGYNIVTIRHEAINRYGEKVHYAKYQIRKSTEDKQ